jgi:hypothetical protein
MTMKRYQCHKQVDAAKITAINDGVLTFEDGSTRAVGDRWLQAKAAHVGGYYVAYADGYDSFSPAKAFEEGYTLLGA